MGGVSVLSRTCEGGQASVGGGYSNCCEACARSKAMENVRVTGLDLTKGGWICRGVKAGFVTPRRKVREHWVRLKGRRMEEISNI
jgi:hypothetical protein